MVSPDSGEFGTYLAESVEWECCPVCVTRTFDR
jgi:hypothetical protein